MEKTEDMEGCCDLVEENEPYGVGVPKPMSLWAMDFEKEPKPYYIEFGSLHHAKIGINQESEWLEFMKKVGRDP